MNIFIIDYFSVNDIQEPFKPNQKRENRQDHTDNFLTSTPRHHYEHGRIYKGQNINRQQQSINPIHRSKPTGLVPLNKK